MYKTLQYLKSYQWNGNIRELENTIKQLVVLTPSDEIRPEHLDAKIFEANSRNELWSGRQDLNLRPSAPKADALPGCATPRLFQLLVII